MALNDTHETYTDEDDRFVIQRVQEISDEFIQENRRIRDEQSRRPVRDMHKVASIPVIFVYKWLKEGFNIQEESEAAIIKKCREEGLDDFLTTTRRF